MTSGERGERFEPKPRRDQNEANETKQKKHKRTTLYWPLGLPAAAAHRATPPVRPSASARAHVPSTGVSHRRGNRPAVAARLTGPLVSVQLPVADRRSLTQLVARPRSVARVASLFCPYPERISATRRRSPCNRAPFELTIFELFEYGALSSRVSPRCGRSS